ncbi:MAG: hypothetical protein V1855_00065 [bacterium]
MKNFIAVLFSIFIMTTSCLTMPSATEPGKTIAPTTPVVTATPPISPLPSAAPVTPKPMLPPAPQAVRPAFPVAPRPTAPQVAQTPFPVAPKPMLPPQATQPTFPIAPKPVIPQTTAPVLVQPPITAPAAKPQVAYGNDVNQITTAMETINNLKDSAKQILKELDEKLHGTRTKIAEAKKQSFEILRKGTEQEAQDQLEQIKKILNDIQALQVDAQTVTSKNLNSKLSEIKVQIAVIETLLQTLQAKGVFTQAQPTPAPQTQGPKQEEAEKELPMTTQLSNLITAAVAYSIAAIKGALTWLMQPPSDEQKKKNDVEQKIPSTTPSTPQTGAGMPFPTFPGLAQPAFPAQSAQDQLEMQITQLSKAEEFLDQIRIMFTNQYQEVDRAIKVLKAKLALYPLIKKHLEETFKKADALHKEISLKEIVLHIVSKTIDLTVLMVSAIKNITIKVYRKFISPSVTSLKKNVKEKLEKIEKEDKESAQNRISE